MQKFNSPSEKDAQSSWMNLRSQITEFSGLTRSKLSSPGRNDEETHQDGVPKGMGNERLSSELINKETTVTVTTNLENKNASLIQQLRGTRRIESQELDSEYSTNTEELWEPRSEDIINSITEAIHSETESLALYGRKPLDPKGTCKEDNSKKFDEIEFMGNKDPISRTFMKEFVQSLASFSTDKEKRLSLLHRVFLSERDIQEIKSREAEVPFMADCCDEFVAAIANGDVNAVGKMFFDSNMSKFLLWLTKRAIADFISMNVNIKGLIPEIPNGSMKEFIHGDVEEFLNKEVRPQGRHETNPVIIVAGAYVFRVRLVMFEVNVYNCGKSNQKRIYETTEFDGAREVRGMKRADLSSHFIQYLSLYTETERNHKLAIVNLQKFWTLHKTNREESYMFQKLLFLNAALKDLVGSGDMEMSEDANGKSNRCQTTKAKKRSGMRKFEICNLFGARILELARHSGRPAILRSKIEPLISYAAVDYRNYRNLLLQQPDKHYQEPFTLQISQKAALYLMYSWKLPKNYIAANMPAFTHARCAGTDGNGLYRAVVYHWLKSIMEQRNLTRRDREILLHGQLLPEELIRQLHDPNLSRSELAQWIEMVKLGIVNRETDEFELLFRTPMTEMFCIQLAKMQANLAFQSCENIKGFMSNQPELTLREYAEKEGHSRSEFLDNVMEMDTDLETEIVPRLLAHAFGVDLKITTLKAGPADGLDIVRNEYCGSKKVQNRLTEAGYCFMDTMPKETDIQATLRNLEPITIELLQNPEPETTAEDRKCAWSILYEEFPNEDFSFKEVDRQRIYLHEWDTVKEKREEEDEIRKKQPKTDDIIVTAKASNFVDTVQEEVEQPSIPQSREELVALRQKFRDLVSFYDQIPSVCIYENGYQGEAVEEFEYCDIPSVCIYDNGYQGEAVEEFEYCDIVGVESRKAADLEMQEQSQVCTTERRRRVSELSSEQQPSEKDSEEEESQTSTCSLAMFMCFLALFLALIMALGAGSYYIIKGENVDAHIMETHAPKQDTNSNIPMEVFNAADVSSSQFEENATTDIESVDKGSSENYCNIALQALGCCSVAAALVGLQMCGYYGCSEKEESANAPANAHSSTAEQNIEGGGAGNGTTIPSAGDREPQEQNSKTDVPTELLEEKQVERSDPTAALLEDEQDVGEHYVDGEDECLDSCLRCFDHVKCLCSKITIPCQFSFPAIRYIQQKFDSWCPCLCCLSEYLFGWIRSTYSNIGSISRTIPCPRHLDSLDSWLRIRALGEWANDVLVWALGKTPEGDESTGQIQPCVVRILKIAIVSIFSFGCVGFLSVDACVYDGICTCLCDPDCSAGHCESIRHESSQTRASAAKNLAELIVQGKAMYEKFKQDPPWKDPHFSWQDSGKYYNSYYKLFQKQTKDVSVTKSEIRASESEQRNICSAGWRQCGISIDDNEGHRTQVPASKCAIFWEHDDCEACCDCIPSSESENRRTFLSQYILIEKCGFVMEWLHWCFWGSLCCLVELSCCIELLCPLSLPMLRRAVENLRVEFFKRSCCVICMYSGCLILQDLAIWTSYWVHGLILWFPEYFLSDTPSKTAIVTSLSRSDICNKFCNRRFQDGVGSWVLGLRNNVEGVNDPTVDLMGQGKEGHAVLNDAENNGEDHLGVLHAERHGFHLKFDHLFYRAVTLNGNARFFCARSGWSSTYDTSHNDMSEGCFQWVLKYDWSFDTEWFLRYVCGCERGDFWNLLEPGISRFCCLYVCVGGFMYRWFVFLKIWERGINFAAVPIETCVAACLSFDILVTSFYGDGIDTRYIWNWKINAEGPYFQPCCGLGNEIGWYVGGATFTTGLCPYLLYAVCLGSIISSKHGSGGGKKTNELDTCWQEMPRRCCLCVGVPVVGAAFCATVGSFGSNECMDELKKHNEIGEICGCLYWFWTYCIGIPYTICGYSEAPKTSTKFHSTQPKQLPADSM